VFSPDPGLTVVQNNPVMVIIQDLQLMDPIRVNNGGTIDSNETMGFQNSLNFIYMFAGKVCAAIDTNPCVISFRLYKINFMKFNKIIMSAHPDL
jgi:hypothetical protein